MLIVVFVVVFVIIVVVVVASIALANRNKSKSHANALQTHTHTTHRCRETHVHTCVYSNFANFSSCCWLRLLLLLLLCRRIRTRKVVSKRVSLPALPVRCINLLCFTFFFPLFSSSQRRARARATNNEYNERANERKKRSFFSFAFISERHANVSHV